MSSIPNPLQNGGPFTDQRTGVLTQSGYWFLLTLWTAVQDHEITFTTDETGANNAIEFQLLTQQGNQIQIEPGLRVQVLLAHSLQAGANTAAMNGGQAYPIKSHRNPANNIATAYVVGAVVDLLFIQNGVSPAWLDMSQ